MTRAVLLVLLVLAALAAPAAAQAPEISAPSAIVVDARTGAPVFERAERKRRPIASTTKLMTALLVLEREKLSTMVPAARYRGLAVESKINLRPGERLSVADLLRGLLVASANDAAVTLAQHQSGSVAAFVAEMNERARALGLRDTRFANPIGLDHPDNFSSARDLATLTRALQRFPFFREVVDSPSVVLRTGARPRALRNRNQLVGRYPWIDGVKTGRTQAAGWVLVGAAHRRGVRLISVVLGTPSEAARQQDTRALLEYGFRRYRPVAALRKGQVLARLAIVNRPGARLDVVASRTVTRRIRRGTRPQLRTSGLPAEVEGPVRGGTRLGTVEVHADGRRLARVPLVAATDVPAASVTRKAQDWLTRPSTLLLVGGLVAVALLAALVLRRRPPREPTRRRRPPEEAAA